VKLRIFVPAIVTGLLLVATTIGTVQAAGPISPYGGTPLTAQSVGSRQLAQPAALNPYGCFSRSDNPHMSEHAPGSASAQGTTFCNDLMPRVYVEATLYRQDCILFVCWNTQVDFRSLAHTFATNVYVNPSYVCHGTSGHKYQINTFSSATGYDGVTYYAQTTNSIPSLPCG